MKKLLKDEEFQKKLLAAIESGKNTDYYFDGEDECSINVFYEYIALENVLKVLSEEFNMALFKAPSDSIVVTPLTESDLEDSRKQYLTTKTTRS